MSRAGLVILNSSSPLPLSEPDVTPKSRQQVIPSTSSPEDLPSPCGLFRFNPCVDKHLKSGSRAGHGPDCTQLSFQSVSGLLKHGQLRNEDESNQAKEESQENATLATGSNLATKKLKAKDVTRNLNGKLKKSSKSEKKESLEEVDVCEVEVDSAQDAFLPAQKSYGNVQDHDHWANLPPPSPCSVGQNGIKAATKFAGNGKSKAHRRNGQKRLSDESQPKEGPNTTKTAKSKKSTGKVYKHFAQAGTTAEDFESVQLAQNKEPPQIEAALREESDPVQIQENADRISVPKRRLNWTPPKDTIQNTKPQETVAIDLERASLSPLSTKLDFSGLMQNFRHVNMDQGMKLAPKAASAKQSTKRKLVEFVELTTTVATVKETSPVAESENIVSKKRKARPKTITACAIERFRANEEQPLTADDKVSRFFGPKEKASGSRSTSRTKAAQRDSKTKRPNKRAKITGRGGKAPGKATIVHPPLLNPEMAAQRIARQEEQNGFLFGTSSQLTREKSPTMLRAIQQSLEEVEESDTSGFIDIDTIAPKRDETGAKKCLWAVGSKIEDVSLLEELDKKDVTLPRGESFDQDDSLIIISQWPARHIADREETDSASKITVVTESNDEEPLVWQTSQLPHARPQRPVAGTTTANLAANLTTSPVHTIRLTSPTLSPNRAALRALSTNSSQQKRPRGRPLKTKANEWTRTTASETVTSDMQPQTSTTERPRGRPRKPTKTQGGSTTETSSSQSKQTSRTKTSSASQTHRTRLNQATGEEEISDWEAESNLTPSPPQRRKQVHPCNKKAAGAELELRPSQEMAVIDSSQAGKAGSGRLTAENPKWPLIAATLFPQITAEVKKGERQGEGGEKLNWWEKMLMYDPIVIEDLTAWLDGKGMRVPNWKMKKGKDGEGDERGGGQLQGWMVQRWCDENSICCVWRESLKSGGRGKM